MAIAQKEGDIENMDKTISHHDRVSFTSRKGQIVTGTITGILWGRKWKTISITDDFGHCWTWKTTHDSYQDGQGLKFISTAKPKQVEVAQSKRKELNEKKWEIQKKNSDRLHEENIKIGDTIVVRGTHYNWDAEVAAINYRESKVGIIRKGADILDDFIFGQAFKSRTRTRTYKWIGMNCIIEVKHGNGVIAKDTVSIPTHVLTTLKKDRYQEELKKNGCTQIKFTNGEFISNSYAFAKEKQPLDTIARFGRWPGISMLDGGDTTVKFDKDTELFWLNTEFYMATRTHSHDIV
jgi:transcriptional regulator of met regulon